MELSKLAEKDPEFYKYLQENDRELLEFKLNDANAEVDEDEEEEKESDWLVGVSMMRGESEGSGFTVQVPSVSGISSTKETCFN